MNGNVANAEDDMGTDESYRAGDEQPTVESIERPIKATEVRKMRDAVVSGGVAGLVGGAIVAGAILATGGLGPRAPQGPIEVQGDVRAIIRGVSIPTVDGKFDETIPTTLNGVSISGPPEPGSPFSNSISNTIPVTFPAGQSIPVTVSNNSSNQAIPVYVTR